jgi:hypothetical protein
MLLIGLIWLNMMVNIIWKSLLVQLLALQDGGVAGLMTKISSINSWQRESFPLSKHPDSL